MIIQNPHFTSREVLSLEWLIRNEISRLEKSLCRPKNSSEKTASVKASISHYKSILEKIVGKEIIDNDE